MEAATRKMLNQIDEFLCKRDLAASELATILSAIRGNDADRDEESKDLTIAVRRAAFPLLAREYDRGDYLSLAGGSGDRCYGMSVIRRADYILPHFTLDTHWSSHIRAALRVCKLTFRSK